MVHFISRAYRKVMDSLFGRITETDARNTYLLLSRGIHDVLESIRSIGDWSGMWLLPASARTPYSELKANGLITLLPESLQKRIDTFFVKRQTEFKTLKKKSDNDVSELFNKYHYQGCDSYDGPFWSSVYRILSDPTLPLEDLKDSPVSVKERTDITKGIAKGSIRDFLDFKDELTHEGERLRKSLIRHYKKDVLLPESRRNVLAIFHIAIVLILAAATIYTALQSGALIERQLESLAPLKPELHTFLNGDISDLTFWNYDLARMYVYPNNVTSVNKERMTIVFQNIGRLDTGHITARLTNEWIRGPSFNTQNIAGESSLMHTFEFHYKGCYETSEECDRDAVPLGIQEFQLSVVCNYCKQRHIQKNITVCIWNKTSKECEEFENTYTLAIS